MYGREIIIFGGALVVTLILAIVLQKKGVTPEQVNQYGSMVIHMTEVIDTNNVDIISSDTWTPSKIEEYTNDLMVAKLKYGCIFQSQAPTNDFGITDLFVYLPNVPFPSNGVIDYITLSGTNIGNGSNSTVKLRFYLFPIYLNPTNINLMQVVIAKEK